MPPRQNNFDALRLVAAISVIFSHSFLMADGTQDHEWLSVEGDTATIGITQHAQEQLGDLVFVELPKPGRTVDAGGAAAVVESVKAASDVYAPVSGEVLEVNDAVAAEPSLVNSDAGDKAWFFKLKLADKAELGGLMDEAAYKAHTE